MRLLVAAAWVCLPLTLPAQADRNDGCKPGAEHALLKQFDGDWDLKIRCHTVGAVKDGVGTETARVTLGSLWLECDTQGTLGGKEFSGRGMIGYDPVRKKYAGVWVDSRSPRMTRMEGDTDLPGKCFTFKVLRDPTAKDQPAESSVLEKLVYEFKDADHHTLRFFASDGNATDVLITEMSYTRRPMLAK